MTQRAIPPGPAGGRAATPEASIIIVAHGRREVTERCLASLDRALGPALGERYELVLVDNASPDDTLALFERRRERAAVVALPENRNFAGGCNAGAETASGRVLIFLNNDTEVAAGTLEALVEEALQPGVGAVGCRLLYPDGTIQHAGVGMIANRDGVVMPYHLFLRDPGDLPAAQATFDIDAVTAACLAVPSELFSELRGFDEAYVNGFEDVDLCLRVRVAGRRVVYRGDRHVVHDEGQTRGPTRGEDRNARLFHSRWGAMLDEDAELMARLFDARFPPLAQRPVPNRAEPSGARVVVAGQVSGLASAAAEARALLACLAAAGLDPAARNLGPTIGGPQLDPQQWERIFEARARPIHPDATVAHVPHGGALSSSLPPGTVVRLAAPPQGPLPEGCRVWAAYPGLVDALVERGLRRDRVAWLPPPVEEVQAGPGGDGVLGLLPTHDLAACEEPLAALAAVGVRVRVLPTVLTPNVEGFVARRLARAELLPPCTDERRLAGIAATADAVLCADRSDAFQRRALVAGSVGAALVTLAPGPAAAVLGPAAAVAAGESLADALARSLSTSADREERAARVRSACAHAALAERVRRLLDEGHRALRRSNPEPHRPTG